MTRPAGTCAFCPETRDLRQCLWPVPKFVRATYGDLVEGDLVHRAVEKVDRAPASVAALTRFGGAYVKVVLSTRSREKVVVRMLNSGVRVKRVVSCGQLCCERHGAERGPSVVYCADHWATCEV